MSQSDAENASLNAMLQNIVESSAIEGEALNASSVRSSLAKRLQVGYYERQETVQTDGLVALLLDATTNHHASLHYDKLMDWHRCIFPPSVETSVLFSRVEGGTVRGDSPMQVVSENMNNPTVHFEAPLAVPSELAPITVGRFSAA